MGKRERLQEWQEKLAKAKSDWSDERERMKEREQLYAGSHQLRSVTNRDKKAAGDEKKAWHVHNIIMENIESEVSTSIPQPKVTARREKDEELAALIENMLRNELDRIAFERINQEQERTSPIQGGTFYLAEWDEMDARPGESGEISVSAQHPQRFLPQPGVTSGVEDMDWWFLEIPQTRDQIERKYGVRIELAREEAPEVRGDSDRMPEDLLTQEIVYYRNADGYIGKFSWVMDTVLEDQEDYYARKVKVCRHCGEVQDNHLQLEVLDMPTLDGEIPEGGSRAEEQGVCPYCGSTEFSERVMEYEELTVPIKTAHGKQIGGAMTTVMGPDGTVIEEIMEPVKIPFYKPARYPLILQRNVPIYGKLLGQSDVDSIADQQNTLNRLDKKIIDRICKAGTRVTLPNRPEFKMGTADVEEWYLDNPADRNLIGAYDFKGDLEYELFYRQNVEEQARKILGITESFQGRNDQTAVSGVAKQFAAAQSAGRLESKRVYKDAAYADLFQLMFELKLAFADEPRPVVYQDSKGNTVYDNFDRYDFLEFDDATGEYVWNDKFLFSVDASAGLASNRQQMWQEITAAFQSGSFGDPTQAETLMLYWGKMKLQHYPGAAETEAYFKERVEREQQAAQMQLQQAVQAQQQAAAQAQAMQPGAAAVPGMGGEEPQQPMM